MENERRIFEVSVSVTYRKPGLKKKNIVRLWKWQVIQALYFLWHLETNCQGPNALKNSNKHRIILLSCLQDRSLKTQKIKK